jgi:uncharacterized protein
MANVPTYPGVHIEEFPADPRVIHGVETSIAAFVGPTPVGPTDIATTVHSFAEFESAYGGLSLDCPVGLAVRDFFCNGGSTATIARAAKYPGDDGWLDLLNTVDLFNLLCIPPLTLDGSLDMAAVGMAAAYCERRRAMLILDPPSAWGDKAAAQIGMQSYINLSPNAAIYFPRIKQANPLRAGSMEAFDSCGAIAGVIARTDANHGVWKAPAGKDATLMGVGDLTVQLNDIETGDLNTLGLNCLRSFPDIGPVVWGARTTQGADSLNSQWKYVPVRRFALFLEESISRGTRWAVFEPNGQSLWSEIQRNVSAFLQRMFLIGAFAGSTPQEAYFVKCGTNTMTQDDINDGTLIILVGFAPVQPAEFVIIQIQQMMSATS